MSIISIQSTPQYKKNPLASRKPLSASIFLLPCSTGWMIKIAPRWAIVYYPFDHKYAASDHKTIFFSECNKDPTMAGDI